MPATPMGPSISGFATWTMAAPGCSSPQGLPVDLGSAWSGPVLSPDRTRLAVSPSSAEHTIWVLRTSGGQAVRIDPDNPDHHSASWSPDGNWIAYHRVRPLLN
jgi:dipeptidyl aminopeptidase/acylaminoacyl peptidase